jgi:glycosyltransferase involved in cell wall biosynthesis
MKIGYYLKKLGISGGAKVMAQHVCLLRQSGKDATLLTHKDGQRWGLSDSAVSLVKDDLSDLPVCDYYVATTYNDVARLFTVHPKKLVHLCQGYEPIEFLARLSGESLSERYSRRGLFAPFLRGMDRAKFRRRISQIESIYRLPTIKAAVSKHLVDFINFTYGSGCILVRNAINSNVFYPSENRVWGDQGKVRVLSIGSIDVGFKGIPDTMEAVRILRSKGFDIDLVRISPAAPSERERSDTIISTFYTGISEAEIADVYRSADIFISSSLEGEGFGLPAIEAMASGVPTILTEISTYLNFNDSRDFAAFVPTHNPHAIAEAIQRYINDPQYRNACRNRGMKVAGDYSLSSLQKDLTKFMEILECRMN